MQLLQGLLGQKNWISLNRSLVLQWGLDATYLFSHLLDCYEYYRSKEQLYLGTWFFATIADIEKYSGISRKKQDSSIAILEQAGVLETALFGMPAKRHFSFPTNAMELVIQFVQKGQTSLYQKDKQDCPKGTNKFVPKGQQIITNITIPKEELRERESEKNSALFFSEILPLKTKEGEGKEKNSAKKESTELEPNPAALHIARIQAELQSSKDAALNYKEPTLEFPEATNEFIEACKTYIDICKSPKEGIIPHYPQAKAQAFINSLEREAQKWAIRFKAGEQYDFLAFVIQAANTATKQWAITPSLIKDFYQKYLLTKQPLPTNETAKQSASDIRANGKVSRNPQEVVELLRAKRERERGNTPSSDIGYSPIEYVE